MIPYFTFMAVAQWFILAVCSAGEEHKEGGEHIKIVILATSTLILWFYQLMQEIIQFNNDDNSILDYFISLQNIGDMICLTLTPVLCLTNYGDAPSLGVDTQAYIGAIVSFFLISKCFDWLRIFEETSFYIMLIFATIEDIGSFMILFMISLIMFAFPLNILNNVNL